MIKRRKEKGFTLVELLAVIVILAIILVIAVPKIMNVIKDTTKASLESSAKMVAAQVENQYTVAQTLGQEFGDTGSCMEDWAGLNEADYESCTYEIGADGNATVTLTGKGKFKGLYVCNGKRSSATATEEGCNVDTFVTHIQELYENETTRIANGLIKDDTDDENIRYAGYDVQNYVEFGNTGELWRIIGVFNMKTSAGNTEELLKIVRSEKLGNMSWDSSDENINEGKGVNEWSEADLKNMLNTYYIGESNTCTYCDGIGQTACTNSCNDTVTSINSTYRSMIESVVWNTAAVEYNSGEPISPKTSYNRERSTQIGKICSATNGDGTENIECNDTITRKINWTGKIGLIYPSDWGYASGDECVDVAVQSICGSDNWLGYGREYWMITPGVDLEGYPSYVWTLYQSSGSPWARTFVGAVSRGILPTLYLKSGVKIVDGDGSSGNPYKLEL